MININKLFQLVYSLKYQVRFKHCHWSVCFEKMDYLVGAKYMSIDKGSDIQRHAYLTAWDSYGHQCFTPDLRIGSNCHIGAYNHITCVNQIVIGDGFLSGKWVTISDNSHGNTSYDNLVEEPARRSIVSKGPIIIGRNVWVGDKATILAGVTIGEGAVIGANCVVTKNVPAYSVVVGNPARVISSRK